MSESIKGEEMQSLRDILNAREQRVQYQRYLLEQFKYPLISYKLNIPGPIKDSPLIRKIFEEGLKSLNKGLQELYVHIIFEKTFYKASGPEHFTVFNGSPALIKEFTMKLEETHPLGRIFDFDILDAEGNQLSRENIEEKPRKCLLCEKNAFQCGRARSHSLEELTEKIEQMAMDYFGS